MKVAQHLPQFSAERNVACRLLARRQDQRQPTGKARGPTSCADSNSIAPLCRLGALPMDPICLALIGAGYAAITSNGELDLASSTHACASLSMRRLSLDEASRSASSSDSTAFSTYSSCFVMGPSMFTCRHPSTAKNRKRSKRVPGYRASPALARSNGVGWRGREEESGATRSLMQKPLEPTLLQHRQNALRCNHVQLSHRFRRSRGG